MNILTWVRERFPRRAILTVGRDPVWDDVPEQAPTQTMPAAAYEPHGIDTPEKLAELARRAQEDSDTAAAFRAAQASAMAEQWGIWDEPGTPLALVAAPAEPGPPPPMPYPSGTSQAMVHQIAYPDPADLTPDKDRHYRDMLRRVGVATGTHTSLEDTGVWALPALEPGDGTGVKL